MDTPLSKIITTSLLALLLLFSLYVLITVHQQEQQRRVIQSDLVEVSMAQYGVLNVDIWAEKVTTIVSRKIMDFELTNTNKKNLQAKIENFLYQELEKLEKNYIDQPDKKNFLGINVRKLTVEMLGVTKFLKKQIPKLAQNIIKELNKTENKEALKEALLKRIEEYKNESFSETDYSKLNAVLEKHEAPNTTEAKTIIKAKLTEVENQQQANLLVIYGIVGLLVFYLLANKKLSKPNLIILLLIDLGLLLMGLLLPMMQIDARLGQIKFRLMGEQILFTDEVLFFKSKSILEVFNVMIKQNSPHVMAVGVLILVFSVVFPVVKLIATAAIGLKPSLQQNKVMDFFAFKTGKWSMADVFIVAIFMAYIGFNSIVNEQMQGLQSQFNNASLLATNNSTLLPGFFLFTCFVLLGLIISGKVKRNTQKREGVL